MRNVLLAVLLLTWAMPAAVLAAELDTGRLPDDAKWVIHLDLDAVRRAGLVEQVEKHWPAVKWVLGKLQQVKHQIGIDPVRDIASVTAYDNRYVENSGVVLIEVKDLDAQRLIAELKRKQPNHQVNTYEGNSIYSWTMHPGRPNEHVVSGAICGNTVVLARNLNQVRRAIDQFDGRGKRVPQDSPLAAGTLSGTMILARATGIADQETPFRSSVLREAHMLVVAVGMDDGDVFVLASMGAAEPRIAVQYRDIVQGFRALASLHAGADDARAQRVISGLTVDVSGRVVSAQWRAAGEDIIALVKNHLEKRRAAGNNAAEPTNDGPGRQQDKTDTHD
jgi:hypothetical protein